MGELILCLLMADSSPQPYARDGAQLPALTQQHHELLLGHSGPWVGVSPFQHSLALRQPLGEAVNHKAAWRGRGERVLGSFCSGLLLRRSTPRRASPSRMPYQIRVRGVQRKTNTNGARYLTDTVHRSVQATFCRVLGQRGTSLLVVLQSQPASCSEGPAHHRPSSL